MTSIPALALLALSTLGCGAHPNRADAPAATSSTAPPPRGRPAPLGSGEGGLATACAPGLPTPEVLATGAALGPVAADHHLGFTGDDAGILRIDASGKVSRFVAAPRIRAVAVGFGLVYWARWADAPGTHEIYVSGTEGAQPRRLATGDCEVFGLAPVPGGVYVAANCAPSPRWVPLSGTPEWLPSCVPALGVTAVASDGTDVYWLADEAGCTFRRASGRPVPFATGPFPVALTLSEIDYLWVDGSGGSDSGLRATLWAATRAGGPPSPVATGLPAVVALTADASDLYWLEETGALRRRAGGAIDTLACPPLRGDSLALLGSHVIWTGRDESNRGVLLRVRR